MVGIRISLDFYGDSPLELVEETHWLMFLGLLADDVGVAITIIVWLCTGFHLNEFSGFFGMMLVAFELRETLLFSPIFCPSYSLKSLLLLLFLTLSPSKEYALRFDIEEAFLDDQSNGWNLQKSEIRDLCALSRLLFIMAVASLYVTAQGVTVVESGQRRRVDPHWFRGNSYFRIGWDWIKTALEQGWQLIESVCFRSSYDPQPAMASRKQHDKRCYRLEFKILTFQYLPD